MENVAFCLRDVGESVNVKRRRKSGRRKRKSTTREGRNRRERVFISANGAIMESLCLVKSHEITTVTASVYSTAERERRRQSEREGGV